MADPTSAPLGSGMAHKAEDTLKKTNASHASDIEAQMSGEDTSVQKVSAPDPSKGKDAGEHGKHWYDLFGGKK